MSALRSIGMIWLMAAAATLPAGRVCAPMATTADGEGLHADVARHASSSPGADAPSNSSNDKPSDEPSFVRPALDVWDGNSSRPVRMSRTAHLFGFLDRCDIGCVLLAGDSTESVNIASQVFDDPSQSYWLICRYAHAPPDLA